MFMTLVCVDRQPLLASAMAKELAFRELRRMRDLHPFRMHAFVLLDDHLHLLLTPRNPDFSRLVHAFKIRFALAFANSLPDRVRKPVWQKRFWDHVVRNEKDFGMALNYIHLNPVKLGYVKDPLAYPHSSLSHRLAMETSRAGVRSAQPT